MFLCSPLFSFRFEKLDSSEFLGLATPPPFIGLGDTAPLPLPVYALDASRFELAVFMLVYFKLVDFKLVDFSLEVFKLVDFKLVDFKLADFKPVDLNFAFKGSWSSF